MSVFGIYDVVFFRIYEKGWDFALINITQLDIERIINELGTILFGQLDSKVNDEFGSFNVLLCDFKGDHFEGIERGVYDLQDDIFGVILDAVKQRGSCSHGPPPQDELFEASLS